MTHSNNAETTDRYACANCGAVWTAAQLAQQKKQAEEMLFEGPEKLGFAKQLFFGQFRADHILPYPALPPAH